MSKEQGQKEHKVGIKVREVKAKSVSRYAEKHAPKKNNNDDITSLTNHVGVEFLLYDIIDNTELSEIKDAGWEIYKSCLRRLGNNREVTIAEGEKMVKDLRSEGWATSEDFSFASWKTLMAKAKKNFLSKEIQKSYL